MTGCNTRSIRAPRTSVNERAQHPVTTRQLIVVHTRQRGLNFQELAASFIFSTDDKADPEEDHFRNAQDIGELFNRLE